jgi:hypothetical protein
MLVVIKEIQNRKSPVKHREAKGKSYHQPIRFEAVIGSIDREEISDWH